MPLLEVDWDKFQFRCHYLGELMTPTRGKNNLEKYNETLESYNKKYAAVEQMRPGTKGMDNAVDILGRLSDKVDQLKLLKDTPTLSDTCKLRLAQIYTEQTTGRIKDIQSVYLEKGLMTEEDSITAYSLRTQTFYRKNKERIENGYIAGEIDFDDEEIDTVIDTKSSWDIFTFDATVAKSMGRNYWWQGQGYCWLKNRKRFRLAYSLNNTPEIILSRLKRQLEYNFVGNEEELEEAKQKLMQLHNYDDLPLERKIRIYSMDRSDEAIEQIKTQVPHFRNYLKNIVNTKLEEDAENDVSR